MRLVFMGTPQIAADVLAALSASSHEIAAVVTRPDKPQGRGLKVAAPPVKRAAQELGLPVLQPASVKDPAFAEELAALRADLHVVVAFAILPPAVIASARLGAVNLHGSLLPRWRGAAPIQRAIEAGDRETGMTIFRLDAGIDTGRILLRQTMPIDPDETSGELFARMAAAGAPLLLEAIAGLEAGTLSGEIQDEALATRAPKLSHAEGRIDWSQPVATLHDKIRAFQPAPGCWTLFDGRELGIARTGRPDDAIAAAARGRTPGAVFRLPDGRIAVAVGASPQPGATGALELREVQPAGKRRMAARDWFNGLRAAAEVVLG